jgi:predicted nucleic acid-binding protein
LLEEYKTVLLRPKFGFPRAVVLGFVDEIRKASTMTKPTEGLADELVTDPHDLPVLATAVAAKASHLVTGNTRHFPAAYRGVDVVTPRQFLEAYVGRTP